MLLENYSHSAFRSRPPVCSPAFISIELGALGFGQKPQFAPDFLVFQLQKWTRPRTIFRTTSRARDIFRVGPTSRCPGSNQRGHQVGSKPLKAGRDCGENGGGRKEERKEITRRILNRLVLFFCRDKDRTVNRKLGSVIELSVTAEMHKRL